MTRCIVPDNCPDEATGMPCNECWGNPPIDEAGDPVVVTERDMPVAAECEHPVDQVDWEAPEPSTGFAGYAWCRSCGMDVSRLS